MAAEAGTLYMARLVLDMPRLFAIGRTRRLPPHRVDVGYLIHCVMADLFGRDALRPFWVADSHTREIEVLAYTEESEDKLRDRAVTFSDPAAHAACDWDRLALKPMPTTWSAPRRLGFAVRVCPVVRMASDGPKHRAGAEVDAFLVRCWESAEESVRREDVYRDWLAAQLDRRGGARLLEGSLERFQLARVLRRTQDGGRKAVFCERPDATLTGVLEVIDGAAFGLLLATGIGRHRAFGFGMLRLRPLGS